MKRALPFLCLALAAPILFAGDDNKKYMQPGEQLKPFHVMDATGKFKNEAEGVCYVCKSGDAPVAMIVATEVDKKLAGLLKELDKVLAQNKDAVGFLVLLNDDPKAATEKLKAYGTENAIAGVALTALKDGKKLPEWLKVDPAAKQTVILYKQRKVVFSTDIKKEVDEKATKEIIAAANDMMKPATAKK